MRKVAAFFVFICVFLLCFLYTSDNTAYAANIVEIQDFYGKIEAYDHNNQLVESPLLNTRPMNFIDHNRLSHIGKMVFYPDSDRSYEYTTDGIVFLPLTYELSLEDIINLTVRPMATYSAVFIMGEDKSQTISVAKGGKITSVPEAPDIAAKRHIGWQEEGTQELFDFDTPITRNYTFVPVYESIYYSVEFVYKANARFAYTVEEGLFGDCLPPSEFDGKTIAGWVEEGEQTPFDFIHTEIVKDYVFYPLYAATTTTFWLVFLDNNGETFATITVEEGATVSDIPTAPKLDLHEFCYWCEEGGDTEFDFALPVAANKRLAPLYSKTHAKITFVIDEDIIESQTVLLGSAIDAPPLLSERPGHNAVWKKQGESAPFDFANAINQDITFVAEYSKLSYTVFFDYGEGNLSEDDSADICQQVLFGDDATPPQITPPQGYEFLGWDKDYRNVSASITARAQYQKIICELVFRLYNLSIETLVDHGTTIVAPLLVSFETNLPSGRYLAGWALADGSDEAYDFSTPITQSNTFYAIVARDRYSITYFDGKNEISDGSYTREVYYGDCIELPQAPAKQHAEFIYWSASETLELRYNPLAPITENLTLFARYDAIHYRVYTQVSEGLDYDLSAEFADCGDIITYTYTLPDGYNIETEAYLAGDQQINIDNGAFVMPDCDVILKLIICNEKYNVEVFVDESFAASVTYGEQYLPQIPDNCPAHYTFEGWYTDVELLSPYDGVICAPYGNAVYLYPKFTKEVYQITFVYGYGDTATAIVSAEYGAYPQPPTLADDEYLIFAGWDKDIVTAECDTTYTACYKVYYDKRYYDGDTHIGSIVGELGGNPTEMPPPQKEGFVFAGYILDSADNHTVVYKAVYTPLPATPTEPTEEAKTQPPQENKADDIANNNTDNNAQRVPEIELLLLLVYFIAMAQMVAVFLRYRDSRKKLV